MAELLVSASTAIVAADNSAESLHNSTVYSLSASTTFAAAANTASEVDQARATYNLSATTAFAVTSGANIPRTWFLDAETRVYATGSFTISRSLGRFQLGDVVLLEVLPPTPPDAAPVVTAVDSLSNTILVAKMALNGTPASFTLPLFLGSQFKVGTFSVTYSYIVNGVSGVTEDSFDVVAGGDPGGPVIAMTAYDRPEAQYVVVQLKSGYLMQGRNPRF